MTSTICTDATMTHGVSHTLFSALADDFDSLKERVDALECELAHKKLGYIPLSKPYRTPAEHVYEALYWCQSNHMTIEFLPSGVRIAEQYEPYRQFTLGQAFGETFLHAVDAMKQKIVDATPSPTLLFQDAKLGQKVQFYDHEHKVWCDAMVLIITHAYADIDTITLRPVEGADITLSRPEWHEAGVRSRPTPPKETP